MEKECLAVVRAFKWWRIELLGLKFMVFTDNSAVSTVLTQHEPVARIHRWIASLTEYRFTLKHRSGKANAIADFLSRYASCLHTVPIESLGTIPYSDEDLLALKKFISDGSGNSTVMSRDLWRKRFEFAVKDDRLYHVTSKSARQVLSLIELKEILHTLHDSQGHFGVKATCEWITLRYWVPSLRKRVENYIKECAACKSFDMKRPSGYFGGRITHPHTLGCWAFDFAGPFPADSGSRYILVGVELVMGWPVAIPTSDYKASSVAEYLVDEHIPVSD